MELTHRGLSRLQSATARLGIAALLALALGGCDPQRVAQLEEGVSTEAEVRKQFGDPVTVTVQPDGARVLDYPRQPEGWTNYVITIGPDGRMSSLRQLLNPDNFARVQAGQSAEEVRALLGRPAQIQPYPLRSQEIWDWRFKLDGQESKFFSVTFGADGKVLGTAIGDDPREIANSGK